MKITRTFILDSLNMTRDSELHGSTADIDSQASGRHGSFVSGKSPVSSAASCTEPVKLPSMEMGVSGDGLAGRAAIVLAPRLQQRVRLEENGAVIPDVELFPFLQSLADIAHVAVSIASPGDFSPLAGGIRSSFNPTAGGIKKTRRSATVAAKASGAAAIRSRPRKARH